MESLFKRHQCMNLGARPLLFLYLVLLLLLVAHVDAGIEVTAGEKITAPDGETTVTITVTGADLPEDGTIAMDLPFYLLETGTFIDGNVVIEDNAAEAAWTCGISSDIMILASGGGPTRVGETVNVTLTGAVNPWVSDTGSEQTVPLAVTRTDTGESAVFDFVIEISPAPPPPVGGIGVTAGEEITAPEGETSVTLAVTGADIAEDGTIEIDVSALDFFVASGVFSDANIAVGDDASGADWTYNLNSQMLTLTSVGGSTLVGEGITLTLTGAVEPWISDTDGEQIVTLPVSRSDSGAITMLNFTFNITPFSPPPPGGLAIVSGEKITSRRGETSPVITITDMDIDEGGTIGIDISALNSMVAGIEVSKANILLEDTAAEADWGFELDGYRLILTSYGGPTRVNETVIVTFTGDRGNPWIADTGGTVLSSTLTAVRDDTGASAGFDFVIETSPGEGGLAIGPGERITTSDGSTTMAITITDAPLFRYDTIVIDVSELYQFARSGALTDANIYIEDTAAGANWTFTLEDGTLILVCGDGDTLVGETVNVNFTGAVEAWVPSTQGEQAITLSPVRYDNYAMADFDFVIDIAPPPAFAVKANFTASPLTEMVPLKVSFTDRSTGNATSWEWDFGDGETANERDPDHTYATPGIYTVSLTASNEYGSDTKTSWNYIHALNGGTMQAGTAMEGLEIANCAGPQYVTVNTTLLPASLGSGGTELVIDPPSESGFRRITLFANDRIGFVWGGDLVSGRVTGVRLETEEIAPASGFADAIGSGASLYYILNLSAYPCDATLDFRLWEGILPDYETKLIRVSVSNGAAPIGTAYTVKISKNNFPDGATVLLHMSVNPSWNQGLIGGPGNIFIWRISDDGKYGQILRTTFLGTDPATGLDHYEATSPSGLSTFGISSMTGNNNPFQMIALFIREAAASLGEGSDSGGAGGSAGSQLNPSAEATTSKAEEQEGIAPESAGTPESVVTEGTTMPLKPAATPTHVAEAMKAPSAFGVLFGFVSYMVENPIFLMEIAGILIVFAIIESRYRVIRRK